MYVFIYLYAGQLGDINERAKERYRLFSPKMFKLNTIFPRERDEVCWIIMFARKVMRPI